MIYFTQTGEAFQDVYTAKEAVLVYAKTASAEKRLSAELIFDPDIYILSETLSWDTEKEPALKNISLSMICKDGTAEFTSNCVLAHENFVKTGEYYTYRLDKNADGKYPRSLDLYVNGKRIPLCRSEDFVYGFRFSGENDRINHDNLEGLYIPERAADCLPDGNLHPITLTVYIEWEFYILHAVSIDRTRIRYDENGERHVLLRMRPDELYDCVTLMNKTLHPKDRIFFFSNHPDFLQTETFCYDHQTGILCYRPKHTLQGDIAIPMLDKLISFYGMDGVTLQGLSFSGASEQYVCDHGYLAAQANVEKRGAVKIETAAVFARDVRRFSVKDCRFYELGTNGLLMLGKLTMIDIRNCFFEDISMCGISIGNPVRVCEDKMNCSYDVCIENNFLHRIGYDFPNAPAIDIFRVDGLSLLHNTIAYCAYSGISVGWEWRSVTYALGEMVNIRDAEIAYNKILHHVQVLKDGAAIYVVGANCLNTYTKYFNFMHHNFAYRDTIRHKIHGYYLDGSSSNWHVYDNVASGSHRPVFAQFNVPEQYTWNNRIDDIYTTEEIQVENHHPERNTLLGEVHLAPTLDELFRKYPKVKDIFDKVGCSLQF